MSDEILKKLDRIEGKLDVNTEATIRNAEQLKANTASLVEHIRRTDLLEQRVDPVEKDVVRGRFLITILGAATAVVGAVAGILRWFGKI
jgi:hypothetical protein